MSRLSPHLPKLGALVLSAVVAAVAYSVYDGQSTTSSTQARSPATERTLDLGGVPLSPASEAANRMDPSAAVGRSSAGRGSPEGAPPSPLGADSQAQPSEGQLQVLAAVPLIAPPTSVGSPIRQVDPPRRSVRPPRRDRRQPGLDDRSLDRELQRLIGDQPAPRRPDRRTGGDLGLDAPAPVADTPVDGAPSGSPSGDAPATDPEAALDDTAVGGLDQTELGEPIDEVDSTTPDDPPPATPAPPESAPVSPPAAAPQPAPVEPAPVPVAPDDLTGNADDEDAGIDDQSGEAEDESPVPPGGSEGADAGVPGDGDDA